MPEHREVPLLIFSDELTPHIGSQTVEQLQLAPLSICHFLGIEKGDKHAGTRLENLAKCRRIDLKRKQWNKNVLLLAPFFLVAVMFLIISMALWCDIKFLRVNQPEPLTFANYSNTDQFNLFSIL